MAAVAPKAAIRAAPFTGFFLDHPNFHHTPATYTANMEYKSDQCNRTFILGTGQSFGSLESLTYI